jgi:hypothetical protein
MKKEEESQRQEKDPRFWGWCDCECACCQISDHHHCPEMKLCGMPKTYDPNEKPRQRY